jgi:hypothetical protein
LEISGDQETFKATLSWDSHDLYGKVEASHDIVLTSPKRDKEADR